MTTREQRLSDSEREALRPLQNSIDALRGQYGSLRAAAKKLGVDPADVKLLVELDAALAEPAPIADTIECIFCKGIGRVAFTPEQRALAKRAVESQRNDVRTMDEKLRDGVEFVIGPGDD